MKRLVCLLLAIALCLSLCACGKKTEEALSAEEAEEPPQVPAPEVAILVPAEEVSATPAPTPDTRPSHRIEIGPGNWETYFMLREIPLYSITSSGIIAQVCQTYCVVLRDEYRDQVISDGDYRVEFSFTFDVYYNTLDIDTKNYKYGHTNDFGYAGSPMKEATATKSAVFDRYALKTSAYGTDFSRYHGYSNAFFSGWANINMESKVWSGFYIDLSQVRLESVSGILRHFEAVWTTDKAGPVHVIFFALKYILLPLGLCFWWIRSKVRPRNRSSCSAFLRK